MKKAKNEVLTENKQKNKAVQTEKINPSEEQSIAEYPFKKVIYGYDPGEVAAYIAELNLMHESSSRMHESKLSSMKEELVLSNRERDSLGEKYRACEAKLASLSDKISESEKQAQEDKSAEYEAEIAKLKAEIKDAEFEKQQLKQFAERNGNKALEEYISKITALETEKRQIGIKVDLLEHENSDLQVFVQKYNALFEEHGNMFRQIEMLKSELDSKEKENLELIEELKEKTTEMKALQEENEENKKKSSELEIKNNVLNKRVEEKDEEIICLKESNKTRAYEYAEKINSMESEQAKNKLAIQKELQLHNYHINQAEIILAEMAKQMEQIKQSLNDIQSV